MNSKLINKFKVALTQELPGQTAQYEMAHIARLRPLNLDIPVGTRRSAVLILHFMQDAELHIVLIRRSKGGTHSRQVGFPGGGLEPQDEGDLIRAALRETEEEIGIPNHYINVLGELTALYVPVSRNMVYPVLGYTDSLPELRLDPTEVEYIINCPLSLLLSDETRKFTTIELEDGNRLSDVPYFDINGHIVWGATAMMLAELVAVWRQVKSL